VLTLCVIIISFHDQKTQTNSGRMKDAELAVLRKQCFNVDDRLTLCLSLFSCGTWKRLYSV